MPFLRHCFEHFVTTPHVPSQAATGTRARQRQRWLARALDELGTPLLAEPQPLTAEASNRRYFRLQTTAGSCILMDAPPATEKNAEFLAIAGWLRARRLRSPEVLASDLDAGFMLLEDLGDRLLWHALREGNDYQRRALDRQAIDTLVQLQQAGHQQPPAGLPDYDRARLERELGRFERDLVQRLLATSPPPDWARMRSHLISTHLQQPRALVYLDYHSRNLLCLADGGLGLLDFQDMLRGPVSYDLVSLLRDCYIDRDRAGVDAGIEHYLQQATDAGLPVSQDPARFRNDFDLCGVQRHLKALGIFADLYLRAGRVDFLADMPRVLTMLIAASRDQPTLAPLADWLIETAVPAVDRELHAGADS